jgi:hypothetical protein
MIMSEYNEKTKAVVVNTDEVDEEATVDQIEE